MGTYWATYFFVILICAGLNALIMWMMKMEDTYITISTVCVFVVSLIIGGIWAVLISVVIAACIKISNNGGFKSSDKEIHHYHHGSKEEKEIEEKQNV